MNKYEYNWSDLAFGSKKAIKGLDATFIAASREMSVARVTQLIKQYLPAGNIVLGCATEQYVKGFENQTQFKALRFDDIKNVISKVNDSTSPHKITVLHYSQSDAVHIFDKIKFRLVLLVNGSWCKSFHTRPEYYALTSQKTNFEFISPFADENEAKKYDGDFQLHTEKIGAKLSEIEMMRAAKNTAVNSFDNAHQTGASLGKKVGGKYELVATAFNPVVPYQTFAWHFGASRERNLSPPGDLNHYDTVHAEVMMILEAQKVGLKLTGLALFINLLPCPTCARMLCETDISEVVYSLDHSEGYAVALLEKSGKIVRRLIDTDNLIKTEGK